MSFEAPSYLRGLREFVDAYRGSREGAIRRAPDVFEFYARLLADSEVSVEARRLVCAVLAYFVVPDDVLPEEELGPYGLLDDLYLAAHVYRILRRELDRSILHRAWVGEGELEDAMDIVYDDSRAELGKQRKAVLAMVGLD